MACCLLRNSALTAEFCTYCGILWLLWNSVLTAEFCAYYGFCAYCRILCLLWSFVLTVECCAYCGILCLLRNSVLTVEFCAYCGMLCLVPVELCTLQGSDQGSDGGREQGGQSSLLPPWSIMLVPANHMYLRNKMFCTCLYSFSHSQIMLQLYPKSLYIRSRVPSRPTLWVPSTIPWAGRFLPWPFWS